MIARAHRISSIGPVVVGLGLMLVWAPRAAASAAGTLSPLPASDYTARAVCPPPSAGGATCMALQLLARSAEARAHRHPIGIARAAAPAPSAPSAAAGDFGLGPQDLHSAYGLPTSAPDAQTIALVDAYNDPNAEADLATYSTEFGLPSCTSEHACFTKVNQSGETGNLPFPQSESELEAARDGSKREREEATEATGWGVEISLDIETVHAVCESCHIVLVEADEPLFRDLETAEDSAAALGAQEISNSWGAPDCASPGECEGVSAFDHPGLVITAAAGDEGYLNWLEPGGPSFANYPATSPDVVAVGGTRLKLGPEGGWAGETVWNDGGESKGVKVGFGATGGGCSTRFDAQPWQLAVSDWAEVGCGDKRAVADVSADADPDTGAAVYDSSTTCEGLHWCTIGGTSLATPLIAATFALAGGANGAEYPAETLYENEARSQGSLHDVTTGSNGECRSPFDEATGLQGCSAAEDAQTSCLSRLICLAGEGYDGPSGVGTPDGIAAFTPPTGPIATTGAASSVTQTTTTLHATVNPDGREVSECKFEYGTTSAYGKVAPCSPPSPGSGEEEVEVSANVVELSPATTYHFRIVARNALAASTGEDASFRTPAPPVIVGESASGITQDDATLQAQVDPEGLASAYEIVLEDPCAPPMECIGDVVVARGSIAAGTADEAVSVDLASSEAHVNLEPNTTYTYWVAASNAAGPSEGKHQEFKTLAETPPNTTTQLPGTLSDELPGQSSSSSSQGSTASNSPSTQALASSKRQKPAPTPDARLASTSFTAGPSGTISVRVRCPAGTASCTGMLTLRTRGAPAPAAGGTAKKAGALTLAVRSFTVAGGKATTMKLRLSASARALLARERVLRARATIFARDPAGATHTTQTLVIVRMARGLRG
ncbi:MAG TPA: S53 family peptidase [Solirubrobacteraceae bacterium]|nr:S53 family peptidase [Solirubrobacteraceae bacterium]